MSPDPVVYKRKEQENDKDGKPREVITYYPKEWRDIIDFPVALAKPDVMEAAQAAMALRLFDEMGVAHDANGARRGDPMILGRFRNPMGIIYLTDWARPCDEVSRCRAPSFRSWRGYFSADGGGRG